MGSILDKLEDAAQHDSVIVCAELLSSAPSLTIGLFGAERREVTFDLSNTRIQIDYKDDWGPSESVFKTMRTEQNLTLVMQNGIEIKITDTTETPP